MRAPARAARARHGPVERAKRSEFRVEPAREPSVREGLKGVVEGLRHHGRGESARASERVYGVATLFGARVEIAFHDAVERAECRRDRARREVFRSRGAKVFDPLGERLVRE